MSSDVVVRLDSVGKCFQVYSSPRDRLKQYGSDLLRRAVPDAFAAHLPGRLRSGKFHDEFWALRDISFELKRGESIGILGMNGAGKSTLLQLVARILKPTRGTVQVNGRLAGLFELGSGFNAEFTGRENVFLNAAMLGLSRDEAHSSFHDIEEFAGIGEFIDRPVKTYSTGMMVRLAFAVQVQINPDILIVDEALAVGDALFQKRCYSRIERFLADGGSLLFVSHDQESVRSLTDHAILLKQGSIACTGSSSEVVLEYRRLLHEQENEQARSVLQYLSTTTRPERETQAPAAATESSGQHTGETPDGGPPQSVPAVRNRTAGMAFGDLDVEIESVSLHDAEGQTAELFYPGDHIDVRIGFRVNRRVSGLNLGFRLRNKEGVKIYSGGTFNQDIALAATDNREAERTWSRSFEVGQRIELSQSFSCNLGEGFYEIQAYAAEEKLMAPGHQRMLHWLDESAFFRVSMNRFSRWYGGVTDIQPACRVSVSPSSSDPVHGKESAIV